MTRLHMYWIHVYAYAGVCMVQLQVYVWSFVGLGKVCVRVKACVSFGSVRFAWYLDV